MKRRGSRVIIGMVLFAGIAVADGQKELPDVVTVTLKTYTTIMWDSSAGNFSVKNDPIESEKGKSAFKLVGMSRGNPILVFGEGTEEMEMKESSMGAIVFQKKGGTLYLDQRIYLYPEKRQAVMVSQALLNPLTIIMTGEY